MEIEKTSKYVTDPLCTTGGRVVTISLPRLRFLENDAAPEPPRPKMARDFLPPPRVVESKTAPIEREKGFVKVVRGPDGLTDRERDILGMTLKGYGTRHIADVYGTSQENIRRLKRRIEKICAARQTVEAGND